MSDQQAGVPSVTDTDQSLGVSSETDQLADVSTDLQALQFGMDYSGECTTLSQPMCDLMDQC